MFLRRSVLAGLCAGLVSIFAPFGASAQEHTLKLQHFLPAQANVPKLILDVWADKVEAASEGRIKVERFAAMALGGKPPELYDQVADGVIDIGWTVVGYTPGRFPSTEVFELPFMIDDARAASYAYWVMYEEGMKDQFSDVHMLGTWVHGPGLFHTADPVETPADLEGMKIRGGSRLVNKLLEATGATPVGMPVPAVPEGLSKGVIDGTTIPWEVTTALKIPELVENHTEFEGTALYTLTFVLAMNKDAYSALPADLQAVIDDNSGLEFSIFAGGTQADADGPAREIAVDAGNNIITIDADSAASVWKPVVDPIYADWIASLAEKDLDGEALIARARQLIDYYNANVK